MSVRLLLSEARAEWLLLNGDVRQKRDGRRISPSHKFPPSRICRRREGARGRGEISLTQRSSLLGSPKKVNWGTRRKEEAGQQAKPVMIHAL